MKQTPHLNATIISLCVLAIVLVGFNYYAQSLEQKYVNALAPLDLPQMINGSALQRAALYRADLLPVYGSSEMVFYGYGNPYKAEKFFAAYPSGFAIINLSNEGASSLTIAQALAMLGPDLKGKKVVISITPEYFAMDNPPYYQYYGNFIGFHAYGLIFSPYLSMKLKSAAAQRMLDYPHTLQGQPVLKFALKCLAEPSIQNQFLYAIIYPFGWLETEVMWLQDHAEVVGYVWSHHINPNVYRVPQEIDWAKDFSSALAEQKLRTLSKQYGKNASMLNGTQIVQGSGDTVFLQFLENAQEWLDFKTLLEVLQELGAKPLIISRPLNVHLLEADGVTQRVQNLYYVKLNNIVNQYHIPLVDYEQYGTDIYFSEDQVGHTSRYGWVYVDQTLDQFFHTTLH